MKQLRIVLIPDNARKTRHLVVPSFLIKGVSFLFLTLSFVVGYLSFDYLHLRNIRNVHYDLISENQHLKGEAHILVKNLEDVKRSLRRIQDYTHKLDELVNLKVKRVSKQIGIGPLTPEEYNTAKESQSALVEGPPSSSVPVGINIDNLIFSPVLKKLDDVNIHSHEQAAEMQQLLTTLSQKKSMLSSIPSIIPVRGWIASGFGARISPFTGMRSTHKGMDIAAPIGTPVHAPADGVVIFAGNKAGFGNSIIVAHNGHGIVTMYGHNAQNLVQTGQKIKRGEQIASVGMSGRTTGPHLHYEVWVNGAASDPAKFILE